MHDLSQPLAATRHERTDNQVPNVQGTERLVSLLGGGLLILGGLRRGGLTGCVKLALGAMALSRGVRQRCELKAALQPSPFEQALAERWGWRNPTAIQRSVTIAKPREEVFAYCTDLQHLRELLPFVDRIELGADGDSHWHASGPLGRTLSWTLEQSERRENEFLLWSTVPGTVMAHKASLTFSDASQGRGTLVQAVLACEAPAGLLGHAVTEGISRFTGRAVNLGLRRLKQQLETGEIATPEITRSGRPLAPPHPPVSRPADEPQADLDAGLGTQARTE
ncbi:SRPBCC family protein [Pseudomonas oryzihabitans]|uniref:SRPBCC family protein n=1 Tax=Pseudomonas oryzihabitans TaxID=47885 RepID=UPI003D04ACD7